MTISAETIRAFATEMVELGTTEASFPRCIAIYADGSVESGYHDQFLTRGGSHQTDNVVGLVKFSQPPELGDTDGVSHDELIEMIVDLWGDNIRNHIGDAIVDRNEISYGEATK